MKKVYHYSDYNCDMVQHRGNDYRLPPHYQWTDSRPWWRAASAAVYAIVRLMAWLYCHCAPRVRQYGKERLRPYRHQGIMIVGNHTRNMGDVLLPVAAAGRKRIHTIVSAANVGLPVVGRWIKLMGGLPIPQGVKQTAQLGRAVACRARQGRCIVVFPEAHVWPWYTHIRPFPATPFRYAVDNHLPLFTLTTVYRKRRHGSRPRIEQYIDGPLIPTPELSPKAQREQLCQSCREQMTRRSQLSNSEYCQYIPTPAIPTH